VIAAAGTTRAIRGEDNSPAGRLFGAISAEV
jgi:hypothetical protein